MKKEKTKKRIKVAVLIIILLLTTSFELLGLNIKFSSSYSYVIKPLMWIFVGIITYFFYKSEVIQDRKYKSEVDFCVYVTIMMYFLIYFIFGYIIGFGTNPYNTSLKGILTNLWMFVPVVFAKECVRYYLINNYGKEKILYWALFISIVFCFIDINVGKFGTYFETTLSAFEFFVVTFLPSILINLYLTYIAYFSDYKITFLYYAIPQIVMYVLPILPNIDAPTLAIINSIIPFFSYIYINYTLNKMDKTLLRKGYKSIGIKGYIAMLAIVAIMLCFGLGVFPIKPLVIASNSMYPKIHRGDIVLIKNIKPEDLKEGDVIRYRLENYYVVHRIKEIDKDNNGKYVFVTKGDNNNDVDLLPVKESQFEGIIVGRIKYVGYPTLLINELLNNKSSSVKVDKGRVN